MNILDQLAEHARQRVAAAKAVKPLAEIEREALARPKADFTEALPYGLYQEYSFFAGRLRNERQISSLHRGGRTQACVAEGDYMSGLTFLQCFSWP